MTTKAKATTKPATAKKKPKFNLDAIEKAAKSASPGPWAYTTSVGAQVIVGAIHEQGPGHVSLEKGGVFLFEIDPFAYDHGEDEDEGERQALRDVKFIGMTGPDVVLAMVEEIRTLRLAAVRSLP